jgi:hypothetical protein
MLTFWPVFIAFLGAPTLLFIGSVRCHSRQRSGLLLLVLSCASGALCVLGGINMASDWVIPSTTVDPELAGRVASRARGRGGIVWLAVRFWPYVLILWGCIFCYLSLITIREPPGASKDGLNTNYYPTKGSGSKRQKLSEGEYKNGKQEGSWTEWHDNGQKRSEGEYKNGEKEGLWAYWQVNGQRSEGEWKNGKGEGPWTVWHENGQKMSEGEYKNGEKEGLWTYWHRDGSIDHEMSGIYNADKWHLGKIAPLPDK